MNEEGEKSKELEVCMPIAEVRGILLSLIDAISGKSGEDGVKSEFEATEHAIHDSSTIETSRTLHDSRPSRWENVERIARDLKDALFSVNTKVLGHLEYEIAKLRRSIQFSRREIPLDKLKKTKSVHESLQKIELELGERVNNGGNREDLLETIKSKKQEIQEIWPGESAKELLQTYSKLIQYHDDLILLYKVTDQARDCLEAEKEGLSLVSELFDFSIYLENLETAEHAIREETEQFDRDVSVRFDDHPLLDAEKTISIQRGRAILSTTSGVTENQAADRKRNQKEKLCEDMRLLKGYIEHVNMNEDILSSQARNSIDTHAIMFSELVERLIEGKILENIELDSQVKYLTSILQKELRTIGENLRFNLSEIGEDVKTSLFILRSQKRIPILLESWVNDSNDLCALIYCPHCGNTSYFTLASYKTSWKDVLKSIIRISTSIFSIGAGIEEIINLIAKKKTDFKTLVVTGGKTLNESLNVVEASKSLKQMKTQGNLSQTVEDAIDIIWKNNGMKELTRMIVENKDVENEMEPDDRCGFFVHRKCASKPCRLIIDAKGVHWK